MDKIDYPADDGVRRTLPRAEVIVMGRRFAGIYKIMAVITRAQVLAMLFGLR